MTLPPGWYPRDRGKIEEFLKPFVKNGVSSAAMAPHAGWYFSGFCAASAVSSLNPEAETVAVIGGHLPGGMPVLVADEDAVRTPLGTMMIDEELREAFRQGLDTRPDRYQDNTVEVLLPMVHYFFPRSKLLWIRFPASLSSFEAGKFLAETSAAVGRRVVALASTDLTHYGENYGFKPHGRGKAALEWVKTVNDAAFIDAVLKGDPAIVLKRAGEDYSACSAGAVLGGLGFCAELGLSERRLIEYSTSADADPAEIPDSFVGYAGISLG